MNYFEEKLRATYKLMRDVPPHELETLLIELECDLSSCRRDAYALAKKVKLVKERLAC